MKTIISTLFGLRNWELGKLIAFTRLHGLLVRKYMQYDTIVSNTHYMGHAVSEHLQDIKVDKNV